MPISRTGTGTAVFIITEVELVQGSEIDPETGTPISIPLAKVTFTAEPSGDPGVTVTGGFTVTSPDASPFIVGDRYDAVITKQVATP